MVWRSQPDDFWILLNDGSFFYYHSTTVTEFSDNPIDDTPPSGLFSPVSGFGRVWGNTNMIQDRIGWGLAPEQGYDAQMQHNQAIINGTITQVIYMSLPDGSTIELPLNDKEGWRRI